MAGSRGDVQPENSEGQLVAVAGDTQLPPHGTNAGFHSRLKYAFPAIVSWHMVSKAPLN